MRKYTINEIAEILLWEAMRDTFSCGPVIYVDDVNARFGTSYSHDDLLDAIYSVDTEGYVIEAEGFDNEIHLTVSCLFGCSGDWPGYEEEIEEFQGSGEMDRQIEAHLSKYYQKEE